MNGLNDFSQTEKIVELLKTKSIHQKEVFECTKKQFIHLREKAAGIVEHLRASTTDFSQLVSIGFKEKGEYYFEISIADDLLVFFMQSNVFEFDKSHYLWQTQYARKNDGVLLVGQISVYNFLADSLKFKRENDIGYPIARIFVNRQSHFFADGKGRMAQKHADFSNQVLDPQKCAEIILDLILFCLDFDLYVPPFQQLPEISVAEVTKISDFMATTSGKKLGFKFNAEEEKPSA